MRWSPDSSHCAFVLLSDPETAHYGDPRLQKYKKKRDTGTVDGKADGKRPPSELAGRQTNLKPYYQLWVMNRKTFQAWRVTPLSCPLNMAFVGVPYYWATSSTIIAKIISHKRDKFAPRNEPIPSGPFVESNLEPGAKAPSRTNPDVLKNRQDVALFEYYTMSQLLFIDLHVRKPVVLSHGPCGSVVRAEPSPCGQYILSKTIVKPYSFQLYYDRFPNQYQVWNLSTLLELEKDSNRDRSTLWTSHLLADLPIGEQKSLNYDAVRKGPRDFGWRCDCPSEIRWTEALDDGDPSIPMQYHDAVFLLPAPFNGTPRPLCALEGRCASVDAKGRRLVTRAIYWSDSKFALVNEMWRTTRMTRMWHIDTSGAIDSKTGLPPARVLVDRSYEDSYSDIGQPLLMVSDKTGRYVIQTSRAGRFVYLAGDGACPEGNRPFIDLLDLRGLNIRRAWQSRPGYLERVRRLLETGGRVSGELRLKLIIERESPTDPPNLFLTEVRVEKIAPSPVPTPSADASPTGPVISNDRTQERQLTFRQHPFPPLRFVQRIQLNYLRADKVQLSADLYLPSNYQPDSGPPLPTILWAYPKEFKNHKFAGQTQHSPYRFVQLDRLPLYFLCEGYAVLDGPSVPIVGEGPNVEPNDTYIEQLVSSVKAAVDECVRIRVTDPTRVAVSGKAYGAFMTATLLCHSNIFSAGIALSGAYNRTLTPFGFQREERTLWDT